VSNGVANTGGGGGSPQRSGGSGIVIIKVPNWLVVTPGVSHEYNSYAFDGYSIYEFTAGNDNITIG
jgi:hypothetical protein